MTLCGSAWKHSKYPVCFDVSARDYPCSSMNWYRHLDWSTAEDWPYPWSSDHWHLQIVAAFAKSGSFESLISKSYGSNHWCLVCVVSALMVLLFNQGKRQILYPSDHGKKESLKQLQMSFWPHQRVWDWLRSQFVPSTWLKPKKKMLIMTPATNHHKKNPTDKFSFKHQRLYS